MSDWPKGQEFYSPDVPQGIIELTPGEKRVLQGLVDGKDFVRGQPGGWWQGIDRIAGRIGKSLWRKALITTHDRMDDEMLHFEINSMGVAALAGRAVPMIEQARGADFAATVLDI